ncbi:MAG: PASTA domain-containing protein [Ruminococcus sp.]|nr:PASTA domain-containing protein [Ruminococcus sp.]
MTDKPSGKMKRRLNIWLCLPVLALLIYMIWGIYKVSIKEGEKWQSLANSQQLRSTVVSASRGTIYDANGNVLAQSATVYTIYADPIMLEQQLKARDDRIEELKGAINETEDLGKLEEYKDELMSALTSEETLEELTEFLALKLDLDTVTVKSKLTDTTTQYIVLKKEVDKELKDEINDKLTELKIDGVRGEPNTKRVYPQNALAANVLGHTDYDGNGIYGLEAYYDDYLAGIDGRVITATDKDGNEIRYRYKQSYDAQDGNDLQTNIDINIQYKLERALEEAYELNKPADRLCSIIMNPKTGQIYAMATVFSYDPNVPANISDSKAVALLSGLDENTEVYEKAQLDAWSTQWKNKAVSELYFPGSVFKIITGASALEEKAITLDDTFSCGTEIHVEDRDISCWSTSDHGYQNLAKAMVNSCNPAFVQIGLKLGPDNFVKYFDGFGFNELSGIDLPGEVNAYNLHYLEHFGNVELATSAFGQTNKVTPIQMATAVSAAINGGYVVTPQVVSSITDPNGNVIRKNEPVIKRQIISEETSAEMREILKGVVEEQKGSNAYIQGYSIGGKSGTSQKLDVTGGETLYVSSYCAFAPAEDPEVLMLVMVDQPTGENYYGSQVAAPICVEVLSEVLPYMGYFPEYSDEELAEISVTVPSVQYYAVDEAKQTMTDLGLKVEVRGNGDSVLKQVPASVEIERGGTVVLYTDTSSAVERTTVPNIAGLTKQQAKELLIANGLNLSAQGMNANDEEAHALFDQSYPEGASVPVGTAVSVTFASTEVHSQ